MNEPPSVYQLVTKLCQSLIKETDEEVEGFSLNCAKSAAFSVLLKNNFEDVAESEKLIQELQFSSFALSLASRGSDAKQVNEFIELLKQTSADVDTTVCWLLVHLRNIDPDPEKARLQVIDDNDRR